MSLPNSVKDREYQSFGLTAKSLPGRVTVPSEEFFYPRTEIIKQDSQYTYYGYNMRVDALTSDSDWRIKQVFDEVVSQRISYADNGAFTQVFDNYLAVFEDIPYTSSLSLRFIASTESHVNFGDFIDFEWNTPQSYSFWVYTNAIAQQTLFSKKESSGNARGFEIKIIANGRIDAEWRHSSGNTLRTQSGTNIVPMQWTNIVLTYDGSGASSGVKFYFNSVQQTTVAVAAPVSSTILNTRSAYLGTYDDAFNYFDGFLDDASIWNKELTQEDCTEIFNEGKPGDVREHTSSANLIHFYRMGEASVFPQLVDSVGSVDGILVNMTSANYSRFAP